MELTRFSDVHAFYAEAKDYLLAHEAHHNLIISLCIRLIEQPEYAEQPPYFALTRDAETAMAAALMTPPHNLVLALARSDAALALIADDARALLPPPGVIGPQHESRAFAELWRERTGQAYRLAVSERIYALDRVILPQPVPGEMRSVRATDRELLVDWFHAFQQEAMHEDSREAAERAVDLRLRLPAIDNFFWQDAAGQPVSFAGAFRGTPNGARIGPVYTPPQYRGQGFASACVAGASQLLLNEGRRFCFLFTNLANSTANHIYQQIGYQPVCDVDVYRFGG